MGTYRVFETVRWNFKLAEGWKPEGYRQGYRVRTLGPLRTATAETAKETLEYLQKG